MYLLDGTSAPISSVFYTTIGTGVSPLGAPRDLQGASIYDFAKEGADPSDVPLPASGLLFGLGLAAFGLMSKRRKNRQA
jgi:hypothetical protein